MKSKRETLNNAAPVAENENAMSVVNNTSAVAPHHNGQNEVIIYQPDSTMKLDVLIENETVWLTQAQMAELFQTSRNNITLHIGNIFRENELDKNSVCKDFLLTAGDGKCYKTNFYSLDVIISVGYRVKSPYGTAFRIWANKVLKEYLLRGYAVNQRFERLEYRMTKTEEAVDFFVKTALPPREGVLFDGQIFDAHQLVCDLIRRAKERIVLIDNYVDESVLALLNKRAVGVSAQIYTQKPAALDLDLQRHNAQYAPIDVAEAQGVHDRFLIVDDTVYHIGASIKDLGKKLFAFSRMEVKPDVILGRVME